jgi:hypothetical protein
MMKASEVAYKAAEIMSERGHCKWTLEDAEGRVCYGGAVRIALIGDARLGVRLSAGDLSVLNEVFDTSGDILRDRGAGDESTRWGAVWYNNADGTTGEDVILLLKETGRKLDDAG